MYWQQPHPDDKLQPPRPRCHLDICITDMIMQPRYLLSFLFALSISPTASAFVVPWAINDKSPSSATQQHTSEQQQSHHSRNTFPQLTWIRDTVIQRVFGVPSKATKSGPDRLTSLSHQSSSQLPAKLLAKYGGDVVLRFNLSTPDEEHALAEAADTLFLDVWEFTNNWADIRLREDDVGFRHPNSLLWY